VLAAVFQYETSPATGGSLSPVRTELSRTPFAMSMLRPNLLVLTPDWSVQEGVRSAPVIVRPVRPVVYEAPAPVIVAPAPVVRVVRVPPPPPPVRVYVHGPHRPVVVAPRVWVRW
jgi:hypothetical protein